MKRSRFSADSDGRSADFHGRSQRTGQAEMESLTVRICRKSAAFHPILQKTRICSTWVSLLKGFQGNVLGRVELTPLDCMSLPNTIFLTLTGLEHWPEQILPNFFGALGKLTLRTQKLHCTFPWLGRTSFPVKWVVWFSPGATQDHFFATHPPQLPCASCLAQVPLQGSAEQFVVLRSLCMFPGGLPTCHSGPFLCQQQIGWCQQQTGWWEAQKGLVPAANRKNVCPGPACK